MADIANEPLPAPTTMADSTAVDLTNLIDYELTFEFRKLTKVLTSMFGVINDVRSEQTRTRADIELLFNHVRSIERSPALADAGDGSRVTAAVADAHTADTKAALDVIQEQVAAVDNRARTIETKLAVLTSAQEVNKAKKMARDVDSMATRLQVRRRRLQRPSSSLSRPRPSERSSSASRPLRSPTRPSS